MKTVLDLIFKLSNFSTCVLYFVRFYLVQIEELSIIVTTVFHTQNKKGANIFRESPS